MNVKPNDSTAKFGSMISVVRNDDCVSPLCSRHYSVTVGYETNRPSHTTSPCVFSSTAQRCGKTVSCVLLKMLFVRVPAQNRMLS